jgi:hypothetical protein
MPKRSLILIELNEVNFDIVRGYVAPQRLKNFARVLGAGLRRTSSESRYEWLEPWIQWVSAHTGLKCAEHGVFRLGDIVGTALPQFFEQVEAGGFRVGAVSPMNAANRLRTPAYFIPDPWTQTPTDGSSWSRALWSALAQTVNDNASGRITGKSAITLLAALLRFARPRHYGLDAHLLRGAIRKPWQRALLLDLFLHDLHMRLYKRHRPNFSTLFLNAGAHIQHHYLLNSKLSPPSAQRNPGWYVSPQVDPLADMLHVYDAILGDYLDMDDTSLVVATGLTQQPYDRIKYYWRLRDHEGFLREIGMRFARALPRMTRDFVVEFDSEADARLGELLLGSLTLSHDGEPLFGDIDNRGKSVFATLTNPSEIRAGMKVLGGAKPLELLPNVAFVAIKNGMHASHGYIAAVGDVTQHLPVDGAHIKEVHDTVLRYFGLGAPVAHDARETAVVH